MIKPHLQNFGLRFALGSLRKLKARDKSGALLLSEERRLRTVALVWALEDDGDPLSAELVDQLERLSDFETVAVVCPPRCFGALRSRGLFFETLPSRDEVARAGVACDWDLYLSRRVSRIRESWAPDFEFTLGRSPEDYLEQFRRKV
ncbi:hypothetical protein FMN50_26945 [Rhodobacterales bacterium]|nr:hypothetical protein FMN50_26945 [Rhodobacterales bacterium]